MTYNLLLRLTTLAAHGVPRVKMTDRFSAKNNIIFLFSAELQSGKWA
jgi:hypothetical protein